MKLLRINSCSDCPHIKKRELVGSPEYHCRKFSLDVTDNVVDAEVEPIHPECKLDDCTEEVESSKKSSTWSENQFEEKKDFTIPCRNCHDDEGNSTIDTDGGCWACTGMGEEKVTKRVYEEYLAKNQAKLRSAMHKKETWLGDRSKPNISGEMRQYQGLFNWSASELLYAENRFTVNARLRFIEEYLYENIERKK